MGRMWEARVEVGVRDAQLHRAAEEALDVGGDLAGVVGQVGLGVALAHRHDELVEGHRCARRRGRLSISRSRCEEEGLRGEGAQASMAIVRPVSDFISVSLIASGAWSEMNGMSPLMPMMPRRGFSRGERSRVRFGTRSRRSLRAKLHGRQSSGRLDTGASKASYAPTWQPTQPCRSASASGAASARRRCAAAAHTPSQGPPLPAPR